MPARLGLEGEVEKEGDEERQIVVFTLGEEEFGVNISDVREIIRMEEITKIPNTAEYIEGVINLRGGIVVVINLAMKLGLPVKDADSDTRIIVLEVAGNTVGMVVDSATEVMRLNDDQIEPAPSIIAKRVSSDYLEGVGIIGERLLILLDLGKVLVDEDYEHIEHIQKTVEARSAKEVESAQKTVESQSAKEVESAQKTFEVRSAGEDLKKAGEDLKKAGEDLKKASLKEPTEKKTK